MFDMTFEYLWGFTNPVPMRAVFTDGCSMPVIGFTAVKAPFDPEKKSSPLVTLILGLAVSETGLVLCDGDGFISYAEPIKFNTKTGEIIENDPEAVYQEWLQKQQQQEEDQDFESQEK